MHISLVINVTDLTTNEITQYFYWERLSGYNENSFRIMINAKISLTRKEHVEKFDKDITPEASKKKYQIILYEHRFIPPDK